MRRLNCFHCLLPMKSPRCASVLGWPFPRIQAAGLLSPDQGVLKMAMARCSEGAVIACRGLIWIQIFAITDFIMFSLMWRSPQIAGLVFSIQVTFANNFYTQFVMLFDAAGFSENPTLCTALSPEFLFPSELRVLFYLSPPKLCWYPDLDLIDSLSGIFFDFPPCIEHSSGSKLKFRIQSLFELWHAISLLWRELAEMRHRRPHITDNISNINIVRFN